MIKLRNVQRYDSLQLVAGAVIDTDGTIKSRTLEETRNDLDILVKSSENSDGTEASMIDHSNGVITFGAANSSLEDLEGEQTSVTESSGLIIASGGVHIMVGETDGSPISQIITTKQSISLSNYVSEDTYSTISLTDKAYYNNKEIATVDQLENVSSFIIRR